MMKVYKFVLFNALSLMIASKAEDPTNRSVFNVTEFGYFNATRVSFFNASCSCNSWGGKLAMIKDSATQDHLQSHLPISNMRSFFFIGLSHQDFIQDGQHSRNNITTENIQECLNRSEVFAKNLNMLNKVTPQEIKLCSSSKRNYAMYNYTWKWLDGTVLNTTSFTNWNTSNNACNSQPKGKACCNQRVKRYNPVAQISNQKGSSFGRWFDKVSTSRWYFLCERPLKKNASATMTDARTPTSTTIEKNDSTTKPFSTTDTRTIDTRTTSSTRTIDATTVNDTRATTDTRTTNTRTASGTRTIHTTTIVTDTTTINIRTTSDIRTTTNTRTTAETKLVNTNQSKATETLTERFPPELTTVASRQRTALELMDQFIDNLINNFSLSEWEKTGAKTMAGFMLLQNETSNISFVRPGLEIKINVISSDSSPADHSQQPFSVIFSEMNSGGFYLDNNRSERNLSDSVVVSASFGNQLWEKNDLSSAAPSVSLESISQIKGTESNLQTLSQNTSILSLSVFARNASDLSKKSIPLQTFINVQNDHTAAIFYHKFKRRIAPNGFSQVCVFFDTMSNSDLKWSTNGCKMVKMSEENVLCSCNHTTSFGVLFAVRSIAVQPAVELFIFIVEVISVVSLAVTSSLLLWLRKRIKRDRTWIQINLSISLMLLHIFFLLGTAATTHTHTSLCEAVAVLTHFFTISSAVWMFNEGFVLYMKTCNNALKFSLERIQRRLVVAGWGIPCVYVGVSAAVGLSLGVYLDESVAYMSEKEKGFSSGLSIFKYDQCWLGFSNNMIYVVIAPLAVIFLATTGFLIRTSYSINIMTRNSMKLRPKVMATHKTSTSRSTINKKSLRQAKLAFNAFITLLPVLGAPWLFAFLVNTPHVEVPFMIIHGVLNGLQGFFIFLIYCVKNEQFRQVFRRQWKEMSNVTQSFTLNRPTSSEAQSRQVTRPVSRSDVSRV